MFVQSNNSKNVLGNCRPWKNENNSNIIRDRREKLGRQCYKVASLPEVVECCLKVDLG